LTEKAASEIIQLLYAYTEKAKSLMTTDFRGDTEEKQKFISSSIYGNYLCEFFCFYKVCPSINLKNYLKVSAIQSCSLSSTYKRENLLASLLEPLEPRKVTIVEDDRSPPIYLFDVEKVIQQRLMNKEVTNEYSTDTIPLYAKGIKQKFPNAITSILDSPAHQVLLSSIPEDQRPPILLGIYCDGINRDNSSHSANSSLHCTYIKIINEKNLGNRCRDDFELLSIMSEETIEIHGYQNCMNPVVNDLVDLINRGIFINF